MTHGTCAKPDGHRRIVTGGKSKRDKGLHSKRGVFSSVVDLQAAINRFVTETNANPKPFTWTADPDRIIAAVRRGHQVLDSIH